MRAAWLTNSTLNGTRVGNSNSVGMGIKSLRRWDEGAAGRSRDLSAVCKEAGKIYIHRQVGAPTRVCAQGST